ncbi:MAG: hypothetical protein HXS48_04190 [Theionarchaea archaeon]|nr:MAG: hypothetical protein AYK19_17770 [Theionarchaea archaeon DG-70-1]MBU7026121.1 hypothetical protein [Theionarchaea archaeon]
MVVMNAEIIPNRCKVAVTPDIFESKSIICISDRCVKEINCDVTLERRIHCMITEGVDHIVREY